MVLICQTNHDMQLYFLITNVGVSITFLDITRVVKGDAVSRGRVKIGSSNQWIFQITNQEDQESLNRRTTKKSQRLQLFLLLTPFPASSLGDGDYTH